MHRVIKTTFMFSLFPYLAHLISKTWPLVDFFDVSKLMHKFNNMYCGNEGVLFGIFLRRTFPSFTVLIIPTLCVSAVGKFLIQAFLELAGKGSGRNLEFNQGTSDNSPKPSENKYWDL